ncbi:hypothetical protein ACHWQZ_G011885 [Mnemiopsis leidyi]
MNMFMSLVLFSLIFISTSSSLKLFDPVPTADEHCPRLDRDSVCNTGQGSLICPQEAPYIKSVYLMDCQGDKYVPFGIDCMGTTKNWNDLRCDIAGDITTA